MCRSHWNIWKESHGVHRRVPAWEIESGTSNTHRVQPYARWPVRDHFKSMAHMISCLDPEAQILILLGRASGPQNQGTRQWSTQRPLRTTTGPWMGRHKGCVPWVPSSTAPKQSGPSLQKTALRCTFKRKPKTKADFVAFMQNIYNCDQAEWAPLLMEISECWYLSIFGVYHPQKPNKIWVVFNSSTQHHWTTYTTNTVSAFEKTIETSCTFCGSKGMILDRRLLSTR